ncbi:tight adherence protein C [Pedococcus dokdonensis]|uniref:Tight adherence protein C n=1 Tax=Pedococcus dokdonensis TaxID=443156 RepID=A0A1H0R471_9MICO|nr:type II secretion system F family protein [Pedococcus dokdonensis]SDP24277.1 tight adherence protein C [Pedococcus dokdonensis]
MNPSVLGAFAGLGLGVGLSLVWLGLPLRHRLTLDDRLLPYLLDAPRPSRLLGARPPGVGALGGAGVLAVLTRPLVTDLARRVESLLGRSSSVARRLARAGKPPDVDRFRAEQVVWGAVGMAAGLALASAVWLGQGGSVVRPLLIVVCGVAVGVVARDQWLSHEANVREQRILREFPTIAELLALAVAAGEGAVGALERVCRLSHGELAAELRRCLADARAGAPLSTALQGLGDRTGLVSLSRFVDGMVVAVERGTPLADVLRAQAHDVREAGRRAVMEVGGTKEIAMMVPVVFLVLPVTVLFAIFPGFAFLQFEI